MEICEGAARVMQLSVRLRLVIGGNFGIVTGTDVNDLREQVSVLEFICKFMPLVIVMAPTCIPFCMMSHLSRVIRYEAWRQSYEEDAPHGRFCGQVAL